jgi:hypothetical protein
MAKKLQLGYREIEQRLADSFVGGVNPAVVGYKLLYSFGKSERDIERYKEGKGVLKTFDGLLIKGLFCYRASSTMQLTNILERLKQDQQVLKAAPKIIAVSDGKSILAYDLREKDTYENQLERLPSDFAFFYPLMDVERVHYVEESPADIKAAEKLAKLHDELRSYNEFRSDDDLHDLNIFISRLLFCFFAEDTGIFEENLFTSSIRRYTKEDGSDLSQYLDESFNVMDLSFRQNTIPSIVKQFPYVNGGLFSKHIQIPKMGAKARRIIIECGELDWKDINPDIFGSMIQAVVNPEERANQGMHYTSVPNIMKVINPLFLDELRGEYNKLNEQYEQRLQMKNIGALTSKQFYDEMKNVIKKCRALLVRMSKMKFFDPACGSGNFLIITYKSLRFLEMDILRLMQKCTPQGELLLVDASVISLSQFYGIELLDFPHEVAMLSLWLAEHQMNTKLNENFGVNTKALPLKNITQIVCGNACRIDWNEVCPHTPEEEVFIFGNPPYLGSSMQDEKQKADLEHVCGKFQNYKNLDYIANWFYLGTLYIKGSKARCAFVSTNSICQGDSVALLWPNVFDKGVEIHFAYQSFKWTNNAKYNATVMVVIIGLSCISKEEKLLYNSNNQCTKCSHINAYLLDGPNIIINRIGSSISNLPEMVFGNKPTDGGFLILDQHERDSILNEYPQAERIIKKYHGADSFLYGDLRYCLWITEKDSSFAYSIPPIKTRLDKVRDFRLKSKAESTVLYADRPYLFKQRAHKDTDSIIVPRVTSERRQYVPVGLLNEDTIISDAAQAIYDANIFIMGILCSHIHVVWLSAIGGKLETRYRYSSLVYNSFPFPKISAEKKVEIESAAEEVLITREYYPDKTLADLYDPDKMPQDLREAHAKLDDIVESCYPGYPFTSDEARLECLFKLYEKMTSKH